MNPSAEAPRDVVDPGSRGLQWRGFPDGRGGARTPMLVLASSWCERAGFAMKRFSIAAVAIVALAVGLLLGLRSDGVAAQGPPDLDRVIEIQERHNRRPPGTTGRPRNGRWPQPRRPARHSRLRRDVGRRGRARLPRERACAAGRDRQDRRSAPSVRPQSTCPLPGPMAAAASPIPRTASTAPSPSAFPPATQPSPPAPSARGSKTAPATSSPSATTTFSRTRTTRPPTVLRHSRPTPAIARSSRVP